MTKEQIEALSTKELQAIIASTASTGRYWQQLLWARDEMQRRYKKLRGED